MRCPACDAPNTTESRFCAQCGAKMPQAKSRPAAEIEVEDDTERRPRRRNDDEADYERRPRRRADADDSEEAEEEGGAVARLIPYKNPKALSSYYFGIFSLIPVLGLLLGPLALLFGILGIRRAVAEPKAKGMGHAVVGTVIGFLTMSLNLAGLIVLMIPENWRLFKETWKVYMGR